jgi:GntR family transcriptional repressor for pyruvate dehydrogenase complex
VEKELPEFAAIVRTRLSDQIAERIHDAIASEQYKPGERLPSELSLATSFKTSRGTIREALRALQATGLLDIRNGAGVFVAESPFPFPSRLDRANSLPDRRSAILEILEIRIVLQSLAIKRCAQSITAQELDALRALLGEMRDAVATKDAGRYAKLDEQFHSKIGDMCDNLMLRDLIHHIESTYHTTNRNLFDLEGRLSQSMEEHERIVDTLARRDEIAAEAAIQRHIESVRDIVAALPGMVSHQVV